VLKIKHILELDYKEWVANFGSTGKLFDIMRMLIFDYGDDPRLLDSPMLKECLSEIQVEREALNDHVMFELEREQYKQWLGNKEFLKAELAKIGEVIQDITIRYGRKKSHGYINGIGIINQGEIKDGATVTVLCSDNTQVNIQRNVFDTYCSNG